MAASLHNIFFSTKFNFLHFVEIEALSDNGAYLHGTKIKGECLVGEKLQFIRPPEFLIQQDHNSANCINKMPLSVI